MKRQYILAISFAALGSLNGAFASLMLESNAAVDLTGAGFSNVSTVLTLQDRDVESGCVTFSGMAGNMSSCGYRNDVMKTGASQIGTFSLGNTQPTDLRVILAANQPAAKAALTLDSLTLTIYSSTGSVLFASSGLTDTSGKSGPMTFQNLGTNGKGDFVFALSADDAAAAATAVGSTTNAIVSLGAKIQGSSGAPDVFSVATQNSTMTGGGSGGPGSGGTGTGGSGAGGSGAGGEEVPEPMTAALIGGGLLLIGSLRRRLITN